jgi:hypothetical protein
MPRAGRNPRTALYNEKARFSNGLATVPRSYEPKILCRLIFE